jgi:hypothetical protein
MTAQIAITIGQMPACVCLADSTKLFYFRHTQIPADLSRELIWYLVMSRHG